MPDENPQEIESLGCQISSRWPGAVDLREAELRERFNHRKGLVKAWRLPNAIPNAPHDLLVAIRRGHPWRLPLIALPESTEGITIPHVEKDGVLCLSPQTAVFVLPVGLSHVEQLVSDAAALLDDGMNQRNFDEFLTEAQSYWRIVKPSTDIYWMTRPAPQANALWVSADYSGRVVFAPDAKALKLWVTATRSSTVPEQTALIVRLPQPLLPSAYPLTMRDLDILIRSVGAGTLLDFAVQKWNARTILPVVLAFSHEGRDVLLGGGFLPPHAVRLPGARAFGIPGFRSRSKIRPTTYFGAIAKVTERFPHLVVVPVYRDYLTERTTGAAGLSLKDCHVIVAGCGSLGGQLAVQLAQSGVGRLTLLDADDVDWRNVGRHVLDASYVGLNKAIALQENILRRYPEMKVEAFPVNWEDRFYQETIPMEFHDADLMISTTGEAASNLHLDSLVKGELVPPVIFGWLEPFGVAAHAILSCSDAGLTNCTDIYGLLNEPVTDRESHPDLPQEVSCGTFFQPFSSLSSLHGVSLVGELAVDTLLGRRTSAIHRVWIGNEDEFSEYGLSFCAVWHDRVNQMGFNRRYELAVNPEG